MKRVNLNLTFTERFHLVQLMPSKDSFENLMVRKDVMSKVELSKEDLEAHGFKRDGEKLIWKDDADKSIKVEFGNSEREYIKSKLQKASKAENLDAALCDIYSSLK